MKPKNIQIIGTELAIAWEDDSESYFSSQFLRKHSPSAENIGEKDIFGNKYGGTDKKDFHGVTIQSWDFLGNYAIRPIFSDGHSSGIYSWEYLKALELQI